MRIQGLIRDGKKRLGESPKTLDSSTNRALGSQILCGFSEGITRTNYGNLTRTNLAVVILC